MGCIFAGGVRGTDFCLSSAPPEAPSDASNCGIFFIIISVVVVLVIAIKFIRHKLQPKLTPVPRNIWRDLNGPHAVAVQLEAFKIRCRRAFRYTCGVPSLLAKSCNLVYRCIGSGSKS